MGDGMKRGLGYRSDIDGLRAIAVTLVVLYHFGIAFDGGFVGVDVFFVISGYLITGKILEDFKAGSFSFGSFFARRMRRLVPALLPVVLFAVAFSYRFYLPAEFEDTLHSAAAAITFVSNWFFIATSGYFDAPPDTKPLLHTWTLGVEWQFYIVLPILFAGLWRFKKNALLPGIVVIALASLGFSAWSGYGNSPPLDAYLNTFARFYELLAGSILALAPKLLVSDNRITIALRSLGIGLIVLSAIILDQDAVFPGVWALVPTLGAALLIISNSPDAVSLLLSLRPVVWIGRISYSLYLWHWPIAVVISYFSPEPNVALRWIGVGISIVFAAGSYYAIERPIIERRFLKTNFKLVSASVVVSLVPLAMIAANTVSPGIPSRFPSSLQSAILLGEAAGPMGCSNVTVTEGLTGCFYGPQGASPLDADLIVWGDSLATGPRSFFTSQYEKSGWTTLMFSVPSCVPLIGAWKARDPVECPKANELIADLIVGTDAPLLLVAAWNDASTTFVGPFRLMDEQTDQSSQDDVQRAFEDGFASTLSRIGDRPVAVLGQAPRFPRSIPQYVIGNSLRGIALEPLLTSEEHYAKSAFAETLFQAHPQVTFIEISQQFCDEVHCRYQADGVPLFHDALHVNSTGATIINLALEEVDLGLQIAGEDR